MTEHVATDRIVYTAQDDGLPIGVLTGFVNAAGGFELEHVIALKPRVVLRLVRAGLTYAFAQGWPYVLFHCPGRHPGHAALTAIGRRLGFTEYAPSFWVAHNPIPKQESA